MTMTSEIYTEARFVPIILLITIIFGRLNVGPARSIARDGPLPIPRNVRALIIGTSVNVDKYKECRAVFMFFFPERDDIFAFNLSPLKYDCH